MLQNLNLQIHRKSSCNHLKLTWDEIIKMKKKKKKKKKSLVFKFEILKLK